MLRHRDIANNLEAQFASEILQGAYPPTFAPLRIEETGASVRAVGQVVEAV